MVNVRAMTMVAANDTPFVYKIHRKCMHIGNYFESWMNSSWWFVISRHFYLRPPLVLVIICMIYAEFIYGSHGMEILTHRHLVSILLKKSQKPLINEWLLSQQRQIIHCQAIRETILNCEQLNPAQLWMLNQYLK